MGRVVGCHETRKPSIGQSSDAAQLGRSDATKPHVEVLLQRFRQDPQVVVVEVVAVMCQRPLGPSPAKHGKCLVEQLRPGAAFDAERLLLVRIGDAESERREESAVRQPIERRQFLGEHDGVAARQNHHAHAELQLRRTTGREGHADKGIGCVAADPLAEPKAVEPETLQSIDDDREAVVVQTRARTEGVTDANPWDVTHRADRAQLDGI